MDTTNKRINCLLAKVSHHNERRTNLYRAPSLHYHLYAGLSTMTVTTATPTLQVPPVAPLGNETINILEFAFNLQQQKETLSRKDFKKLVQSYGWTGEEKIYLKLASVFGIFSPSDLAAIEPNTLFLLARNHKKYAAVIEQLASLEAITQDAVKNLMKLARKPKRQVQDKTNLWRQSPDGGRHVQFPPVYDEQMGVMLHSVMDESGLTFQQIMKEGLCLRKGLNIGLLGWVSGVSQLEALMAGDFELEAQIVTIPELEELMASESIANTDAGISQLEVVASKPIVDTNDAAQDELSGISEEPIVNISDAGSQSLSLNTDDVPVITNFEKVELNHSNNEWGKSVLDEAFDVLSSLSKQLFYFVENYTSLTLREVKEAEKLVREIINFCNSQPAERQWFTLADITLRNSTALTVVTDCTGSDNKEWFFNLPQLLAECAIEHQEELLWVDAALREEAESMLAVQKLNKNSQMHLTFN